MTTFVALLRGINLGAKRRIAMPALRESLGQLGLDDVVTHMQSGNVVFSTGTTSEARLGEAISDRIRADFGLDVPVILRTGVAMQRILTTNPFLPGEDDSKRLHVTFLDREPDDPAVARLAGVEFPPDDFDVRGREIFVRHMNGVLKSPIDFELIARRLGVERMTSRNWRTVAKLARMAGERS